MFLFVVMGLTIGVLYDIVPAPITSWLPNAVYVSA